MISQAPREQDVFTSPPLAAGGLDALADLMPQPAVQRFSDLCHEHHRQAAQHRTPRLRTIDQLRRGAK